MDMKGINITDAGVRKLLDTLNPNKSSGPDNISGRFLRMFSIEIAPILHIIVQQSPDVPALPNDWKQAHISPIYKRVTDHTQ